MFKKIFIPAFILITIFSSAIAQSDTSSLEHALLWKITDEEAKSASYLYGTIHIIDAKDYVMNDTIEKAFNDCERITFEIDMKDMTDMSALFPMMMKMFMVDTTLRDLVSEEEYAMVEKHFAGGALPLPMSMLEKIKPLFLTMMDPDMQFDMNGKGGAMKSYEMEFFSMAEATEKETAGLETIAYQMGVFDKIPLQDQADMLMQAIEVKADTSQQSELEVITKIYLNRDITAMHSAMDTGETNLMDYEDVFLKDRNENWIPIMKDQMAEKPTFFAVGAGHLAGENGVIKLLRKEGYTVEAVW